MNDRDDKIIFEKIDVKEMSTEELIKKGLVSLGRGN